jgi:glycosyltransferase involved in cell wall biosynthesis
VGQSPLISVIVPFFNTGAFLTEALQSIRDQGVDSLEVIVVDDGSDASPETSLREICPEARFFRQENGGPSAARNRALRAARGELIAFLDADDLWAPGALPALLEGFESAPSVQMVQGHLKRFYIPPASGSVPSRPVYGRLRTSFNVGSLLLRRSVFDRVGMFDEALRYGEDVDLHIRLRENGIQKLIIPDLTLLYRRHAKSMTADEPPRARTPDHYGSWMRLLARSLRRRRGGESETRTAPNRPSSSTTSSASVTAVIAVKNGGPFLATALESLEAQELPPDEILCVVGASNDETWSILGRDKSLRIVEQEGDGLAAARNQAIQQARGDWIAFLDHDDLWLPAKLEAQLDALSMLRRPGYSITNFKLFREFTDPVTGVMKRRLERECRLGQTPSTLLAHREVLERSGGFDESLGSGCDSDWFWRAIEARIPCAVVARTLVHKRLHDKNLSADWRDNREQMFQVISRRRRRKKPSSTG